MFSLTTNGSPAETEQAYSLLAIIADPKLAQKHLDMLFDEKQSAVEAMNSARDQLAEAKQHHDDAQAKLTEAARISDEFNATHETRTKQLNDHSDFLAQRQERLDELEAAQTKRESDFDRDLSSREEAVKAREVEVTQRETIAKRTGDEAQLLKETYERKVSALQAALSPDVPQPVSHVLTADTGSLGAPMGEM